LFNPWTLGGMQESMSPVSRPMTLDEPISVTIGRDLGQVAGKLRVVLMPIGSKDNNEATLSKLREWDLWGPLLVCLLLSLILSGTAPGDSASLVFAAVFVIVWCGATVVSLNAQLLGGTISFFQSVCILGYCVFPLTISSLICFIMSFIYKNFLVKLIVTAVGFIWSTRASVVFMANVIKEERRTLAVFPVFFFYTFIGWMILLQ
jgi:protein YIPF6